MVRSILRVLSFIGLALVASTFLGCPFPNIPGGTGEKTLAQLVVQELGANLGSASGLSGSMMNATKARGMSQGTIDSITAGATNRIKADGLANSTELDKLLVSMINGVQQAMHSVSLPSNVIATVMSVTTESAVGSLGVQGRQGDLGQGITQAEAVSAIAETAIRAIMTTVPDKSLVNATIASALSEAAAALDAAEGISAAVAAEALAAFVEGAVRGGLASDASSIATLVQTVNAEAVTAICEMTKVTDKAGLVEQTVSASVTAAAENVWVAADLVDIVMVAVAAATQSSGDASLAVDSGTMAAAVSQALADAGSLATVTPQEIDDVVTEAEPVMGAVTANPSAVTASGTTVDLSAAATPGSGFAAVTYTWTQVSGPVVSLTQTASSGSAHFLVPASGSYVLKIAARNDGGYKQAEQTLTLSASFTLPAFAQAISDGIEALKVRNFDLALTKFTMAAAIDPTSATARTWKALMDLASVSIDPSIVTLLRDRIGLLDYPTNMNALFQNTWLNGNWYQMKYGMTPVASPVPGSYYYVRGTFTHDDLGQCMGYYASDASTSYTWDSGTFLPGDSGTAYAGSFYLADDSSHEADEYIGIYTMYSEGFAVDLTRPVLMPRMDVPAWASSLVGSCYLNEDADHYAIYSFMGILMVNIIDRNPTGLDSALDLVLGGAFGSRFETAMSEIAGLPDSSSVQIPNDLLAAYGMTPTETMKIMLDKSELLASAASLKTVKSFLQLLSSYKLTYPMTNLNVSMWSTADANANGLPDWADSFLAAAPNPVKAGMFTTRSALARMSAKTTMIDALDSLSTAIGLLQQKDIAAYLTDTVGTAPPAQTVTDATNYLSGAKGSVTALRIAITSGSALYLDSDAFQSGAVWSSSYVWPGSSSSTTVTVYPGKLYSDDLFNPGKLLDSISSSGQTVGLKVYGVEKDPITQAILHREELTDKVAQAALNVTEIDIAINWSRTTDFLVLPSSMTPPPLTDGKLFMPFIDMMTSAPLTDAQWALVNWLRGN